MASAVPAAPLSQALRAFETGGFASPPRGGFALWGAVKRHNEVTAICLLAQTPLSAFGDALHERRSASASGNEGRCAVSD